MRRTLLSLALLAGISLAHNLSELTSDESERPPAKHSQSAANDTIAFGWTAESAELSFADCNKRARAAFRQGDYVGAADLWKKARHMAEGSSTENEAIALANLATLEYSQGNPREALAGYRVALQHWNTVQATGEGLRETLRHMGDVLRLLGEYDEARQVLKRLSGILEKDALPDADGIARLQISTAKLESAVGKAPAAANLYRQVLASPTKDSSLRATAWDGLSEIYLGQGKFPEADEAIRTALTLWESVGNRIKVAATANRIGDRWLAMRKPRRALPYLHSALAVFEEERIKGAQLASTLNNLGQAYRFEGNSKSAVQYFERALSVATRDLGANHPFRSAILVNLGDFALSRKKLEEAEHFLRQAISIDEQRLDHQDPAAARDAASDIARDAARLAKLHLRQKRFETACQELGYALSLRERSKLPFDTEQADWFDLRASLLRHTENYVEAARLEAKALRIRIQHASRQVDVLQ